MDNDPNSRLYCQNPNRELPQFNEEQMERYRQLQKRTAHSFAEKLAESGMKAEHAEEIARAHIARTESAIQEEPHRLVCAKVQHDFWYDKDAYHQFIDAEYAAKKKLPFVKE